MITTVAQLRKNYSSFAATKIKQCTFGWAADCVNLSSCEVKYFVVNFTLSQVGATAYSDPLRIDESVRLAMDKIEDNRNESDRQKYQVGNR